MAAAISLPVRNPRTGEFDYDIPVVSAAAITSTVQAL